MSKSNSKLDAFEMNLKQIQQTNDILYSIENKLNDVFLNQSPSYKKKIDFQQYIKNSKQKMSPQANEFFQENPSFNKENQILFQNSTTKLLHPIENLEKSINQQRNYDENYFPIEYRNENNYKEDTGYVSSIKLLEDHSENKRSLYSIDLKSKEELDNELKNLQKRLFLLERENEMKSEELKTSRQKIINLENNLSAIKNQKSHLYDLEDNFIQKKKINDYTDYNQAKIEMLEAKVKEINIENKNLIRENTSYFSKIYELEQELKDNQKILKNLDGIKLEYEEKISILNQSHMDDIKKIIDDFKKEINNLNNQVNNLSKEKEDFANNQKILEREKNKLNSSYSSLLNIHNQMLKIDIVKNEKNMQNSFCDSNNGFYNNNISDSDRNSKKILENLQNYKSEIEKLKTKSFNSDNYFKELINLKEEIASQKNQNESLLQEINSMKSEKKNDLEAEKMQEYIQKLELAYKNIEGKYNEQLSINKEIKINWKHIEDKNKDSYDKIERIYQKFCENEHTQISKDKIILNSCPISTKNSHPISTKNVVTASENKNKTVVNLMKTKKVIPSSNFHKSLSKQKRSNSNNNNYKK